MNDLVLSGARSPCAPNEAQLSYLLPVFCGVK